MASSGKKKTIVFVGGTILSIANKTAFQRASLLKNNYCVYFMLCGDICPELFENQKISFYPGRRFKPLVAIFPFWVLWKSFALILREDIDAIYTTYYPTALISGFLAKYLLGLKWIADIWDEPRLLLDIDWSYGVISTLSKRIYYVLIIFIIRRTLRFADLIVIALVPDILHAYGVDPDSDVVVAVTNGVDLTLTTQCYKRRSGSANFNIVFVGPLKNVRGVDTMLSAAVLLKKKGIDFNLLLVGYMSDIEKELLETFLRQKDLSNEVTLVDQVEHDRALSIISEADVCLCLLSPSIRNYHFSYPVKIFEYMAMSKVTIATDLKGIRRIITNRENGILIPPDDYEKLAEAIMEIYSNPSLRIKIERNSFENVKQYDWSIINNKILSAIDKKMPDSIEL